jgi:serine protease Do
MKFSPGAAGGGLGSGMIFRADGYIITNAHVVRGGDKTSITVKMADEREFRNAQLVGIDEGTDIAVLKINANNLPTVKLGDSSNVRVGDWAIAVGNPFGLEHTVTVGVISAKSREVQLSSRGGDYLQTDASINPGNSGGPLCDINGRVIGVNNAIYSESGGNMGIGFAIPVNTARDIAERLVRFGKITRGYLGVNIRNLDNNNAAEFGIDPKTKGVLVEIVNPNTPGQRAGLKPGDVVTAFNGKTVTRSSELQALVGAATVGSMAKLTVLRGGTTVILDTKIEELKPEAQAAAASRPSHARREHLATKQWPARLKGHTANAFAGAAVWS